MKNLEEFVNSTTGEDREILDNLLKSYAESIQEKNILRQKIGLLSHENRLLKKRLFGSQSEKIKNDEPSAQTDLPLFNEIEVISSELEIAPPKPITGATVAPESKPSAPRRKPLPSHLKRIIVEHDLSPEEKQCPCGAELECIGKETREELIYVPAKLEVVEHQSKKYICRQCVEAKETDPARSVTSKTAPKPPQLIPKSFASPSLLAHIAVAKFCDHLPLYRQEQIFERLQIDLPRQTMSAWMIRIGEAIIPLINLLQDTILNYDVAFADETTLQVLNEPGRRAQTKSFIWCFVGGPPDQRCLIYQYHPQRSAAVAQDFFADYQGGLHCDGYGSYFPVLKSPQVVGLNCWAHVRRKFIEALPNGKEKGVAGHVVKFIRALYRIEEGLTAEKANPQRIWEVRQQKAVPILNELKLYLDEKAKTALPSSPIGATIAYTLKRWSYLTNYLKDGRYEIDNNRTERAIKPFVLSRKNWLFANSVAGAHTSARLFSLIETAKAHQLNPVAYLEYAFKKLPTCASLQDYEALLPFNLKDIPFLKNNTSA